MRFRRFVPRHHKTATAVACLSVIAATVVVLSSSLPAQTALNGAELAQQYLAALKPAGAAISNAEASLEKLPVTASVAQVKAIVAPLDPALAKLEALSPTSPMGAGRGLESLGLPTVVGSTGAEAGCGEYGTAASGAVLQVGYTRYHSGFQMTTQGGCFFANWAWVNYRWKVPAGYTLFKADIAYNYNNGCISEIVRFLGDGGSPLQFASTKNKLVASMPIPTSGLAPVTVNFAGNSSLTVQVDFNGCAGGNPGVSIVDMLNDQLS
jgi:hypothetical protein